jgi:pyruvate/2-oxoglutarate dehydrogenase complex dihydrolipoamide acyltransferase (E2) component
VSSSPTETTVQVVMPQMGVSVAEGTIVEWTKRPGDWVERDETVCLVTTDKVDVEIPAPAAGRFERTLVSEGDTVAVGTQLAELDTGARPGEAHPEEHDGDRAATPAGEGDGAPGAAKEAAPEAERPAEAAPQGAEADRSRFYSPVVRRIAEEHGVDLSRVEGTGIGGRIRKRDVLAFVESGAGAADAAPERAAEPAEHERPLHTESPYVPEGAAAAQEPPAAPERPPEPAARPEPRPAPAARGNGAEALLSGRREPLSPMRKLIAEHMTESRRTAAHCTTIVEVDLHRVVAARRALKERMASRGVPLTYLAFVATATVAELERHPVLNASIEGEEIAYHDDVNLGIAVALEKGLIVPVIRQAQRLSLEGLAAEIAELAERARNGALEPDDVHGGTFTITNPGQFGAVLATPIINQPQVAILDLEAVVKRPVVVEDEAGESISIRPITYLCMSWDHRALDGAEAARFLSDIKSRLEGWEQP